MNILVTGAGGFIGSHVVRAAAARGHRVYACVRSRREVEWPAGVTPLHCDYRADQSPEAWLPRLAGIDVVVNAVGIIRERGDQTFEALHARAPMALFRACARAGVRRVVQISALGADAGAQSRYHLSKREADDLLATLPLEWVILRPSLVYGPGGGSDTLFHALAALPVVPLVGDGRQLIRPVHIEDLTRAIVASIEEQAPAGRRVDAVGGEEVEFGAYLRRLRRWLGYGALRALHVPGRLALHAARTLGFLGEAPVDGETVAMLQRGNTAPVEPFTRVFGFRPSGVSDWLARRPARTADRRQARLFFLHPLLRFSIGFVWVWAGVTSAWLYPRAASDALLAAVGITGGAAALALYGAAALDLALGLALWIGRRVRDAARLQLAVMLAYTTIITVWLPGLWLHPFGPVAKNVPLLAATLVLLAMEDRGP
jgi:uncharacterized protein YbjT (DUF2867 family)